MKDLYQDENKARPAKTEAAVPAKKIPGRAYRILVKPLITEKAANIGADSKYLFEVEADSNKIEISKAISEVYGVKPTAVNIIRISGKKVRHGRTLGRRKDWKKAVITLPKGKTINIYEGV